MLRTSLSFEIAGRPPGSCDLAATMIDWNVPRNTMTTLVSKKPCTLWSFNVSEDSELTGGLPPILSDQDVLCKEDITVAGYGITPAVTTRSLDVATMLQRARASGGIDPSTGSCVLTHYLVYMWVSRYFRRVLVSYGAHSRAQCSCAKTDPDS